MASLCFVWTQSESLLFYFKICNDLIQEVFSFIWRLNSSICQSLYKHTPYFFLHLFCFLKIYFCFLRSDITGALPKSWITNNFQVVVVWITQAFLFLGHGWFLFTLSTIRNECFSWWSCTKGFLIFLHSGNLIIRKQLIVKNKKNKVQINVFFVSG